MEELIQLIKQFIHLSESMFEAHIITKTEYDDMIKQKLDFMNSIEKESMIKVGIHSQFYCIKKAFH